jgi:hypothetical protein
MDLLVPCLAILLIHYLVSFFGFHSFSLITYPQVVQNQFPTGTPFWEMLFYFHGNPPLLSIIHKIPESFLGDKSHLFFDFVLPWLHLGSYLLFRNSIANFGIRINHIWILIFRNAHLLPVVLFQVINIARGCQSHAI